MNELQHSRKGVDFPDSITEGFRHLEKLDYSRWSHEKIASFVEELIFADDPFSRRPLMMTATKELQMLERIASYFWEPRHDAQHVIFMWLFMPGNKLNPLRFSILNKLIGLALADSNANVLNHAAVWISHSHHAETPCMLTSVLLNDHLLDRPNSRLRRLPEISPHFCCGFLTCLTSIYRGVCPPADVLALTLEWLESSPSNCFAGSPLPGLVHWCTVAPLLQEHGIGVQQLSQLHLKVLELIKEGRGGQSSAIFHPSTLVDLLARHRSGDIQPSLERLAQCLQVALSRGSLLPELSPEILRLMSDLPRNRLLSIVAARWKLHI